jgi:hypothetical protein
MESKILLPEFQDFLIMRKLVPEAKTRFYARWVSKFLAFFNRSESSDVDGSIAPFLKNLADGG